MGPFYSEGSDCREEAPIHTYTESGQDGRTVDTLGNRAGGQGGLRREGRTEDVEVGGWGPSERSA